MHGLLSLQLRAPLDWQMPLRHVSVPLQTLPSVHEAPSLPGEWVQTPAPQTSAVQGFESAQSALEPHTPLSFLTVLFAIVTSEDAVPQIACVRGRTIVFPVIRAM